MRRGLIVLSAVCLVALGGCGSSGVSQEEYDKVVAERDELKNEYDSLGKMIELKAKAAEYTATINAEYEHAKFVFTVAEKASGFSATESINLLNETHTNTVNTIDESCKLFEKVDSLTDVSSDTLSSTIESIDKVYEAWEDAYNMVLEFEKILTNSDGVSENNSEEQNKESAIYQDETVIITYKGLSERKYGNGYEINFEVENLTEKTLMVQLRDTSINGIMVKPMYSVDIAPNKKSISGASITGDDSENLPMNSITNIETKFSITNDNDWGDSYETSDVVVLNIGQE